MPATEDYIAIDLGASSGRVAAGQFDGRRLALREVYRFPNAPIQKDGFLRWNLPNLLTEIETGLQRAISMIQNPVSIGCDTWGVDHGFIDAEGRLLAWPFSYQDPRTQKAMAQVAACIAAKDIFARTASVHTGISTLHQLAVTQLMHPDLLKQSDKMLFMSGLIHHHLTGARATELTMASTSQLCNWRSLSWDEELINTLDLPRRLFPEIVMPGASLGPLRPEIRDRLGLPAINVHIPACHDTASAMAAMPVESPSDLMLSSGTWSMLGIRVKLPVTTVEALEYNCGTYALPGPEWILLRGIMGLWLLDRFCRESGHGDAAALSEQAQHIRISNCLFNPEDERLEGDGSFLSALGNYCKQTGQAVPDSDAGIARSILESLALYYDHSIRILSRLSNQKIQRIILAGGGSRNRLLNQLTANASGLPVLTSIPEMTVAGNILVQAAGRGRLANFNEMRSVVRESWPIETFEPRDEALWQEKRTKFAELKQADT